MNCITYGLGPFEREQFRDVSDVPFCNKARGGLWASPVDAEFGWKDWCYSEDFNLDRLGSWFTFDLVGRILVIDSYKDAEQSLAWIDADERSSFPSFQAMCCPDFVWDAIHLTSNGEQETRFTRPRDLYGWDCESVFVMNPDVIQNVDNSLARAA